MANDMKDRRPENLRDIVDPYVAEALYEETIAWNIDMRGGGSVAEWPSWEKHELETQMVGAA